MGECGGDSGGKCAVDRPDGTRGDRGCTVTVFYEGWESVDDRKSRINLVWDNQQQTWLFVDKFEP